MSKAESSHGRIRVRRIYDAPAPDDGSRILVDRLWPRGMSKSRAHLDEWCKQIAPSTELRTWYHHDAALYDEFARRYCAELQAPEASAALAHLKELASRGPLTLLTASAHPDVSQAAVLADLLTGRLHVA